jgi:hypothetical protein
MLRQARHKIELKTIIPKIDNKKKVWAKQPKPFKNLNKKLLS